MSNRVRCASAYRKSSFAAPVLCALYILSSVSDVAARAQEVSKSDAAGFRRSLKYPLFGNEGDTCMGIAAIQCRPPLVCGNIDRTPFLADASGICQQPDLNHVDAGKGEFCGGIPGTKCGPGLTCKYKKKEYPVPIINRRGQGTCVPSDCTCTDALLGAVCAKDLRTGVNSTYSSPCKASCGGAFVLYRGACAQDYNPNLMCKCTNDYKPVCATDPESATTQTYTNVCLAGCGRFPVVYEGNCTSPGSVPGKSCDCGSIDQPVCASQDGVLNVQPSRGKTFKNLCTASCSGYSMYGPGKCGGPVAASELGQASTPL